MRFYPLQIAAKSTLRDYILVRATEFLFKSIKTASNKTHNDSDVQEAIVHKFLRKVNGLNL